MTKSTAAFLWEPCAGQKQPGFYRAIVSPWTTEDGRPPQGARLGRVRDPSPHKRLLGFLAGSPGGGAIAEAMLNPKAAELVSIRNRTLAARLEQAAEKLGKADSSPLKRFGMTKSKRFSSTG